MTAENDAEVGRFINADATDVLHNASGISDKNIFTYCGNNAINNIDSTGQKGIKTSYLALILDIALSIACLYGAVTYSAIGAGFKALYKTVGYKAFRMLVKKPLVRKAVKAYFKFMKDVKRLARKYLRAIIPNLKESALTSLITKWLTGKVKIKMEMVILCCSLGGLLALLFDIRDGRYDGVVYFKKG